MRDVQNGLTDRTVYERHEGRFLVFPVCGVGFSLQDLRFIPTYFVVFFETLLVLTHDPGCTDQTMNGSSPHMMWVAGLEVQITSSMSRFPIHSLNKRLDDG
jgi:hypothetical protein